MGQRESDTRFSPSGFFHKSVSLGPRVIQGLNQMGIETPETCKHLGLHLGKNIEDTMEVTMRNTEPKRIKRRILGTTPPTDILHRALLINTALIPIYNHIFMALPVQKEMTKKAPSRNTGLLMDQTT